MSRSEKMAELQIHDVFISPLTFSGASLDIYKYRDHLLARVGLIQYQTRLPSQPKSLRLRQASDEIWCLLEGECSFVWKDLREESPSYSMIQRRLFSTPTLVLAPYGVAFGIHAKTESRLLRIASLDETEDSGGEILPWLEK